MTLIYDFLATTFTLTLPDLSQPLLIGVANSIISFCYFAIASLISLGLWRSRQSGFDTFATVTAVIFWSCAFGHSGHAAEHLGLPHSPVVQTVTDWMTVIPAIAFLSLSNRYSLLVGSTQILQAKKDTEQALSETTQRFQAIFDQAFQLIVLLEPDGTLIEANQTALDFGNYQPSEVLERKFWDTPWWESSPTSQQDLRTNIKQVSAGKFVRSEYEITGVNHQSIVIDISFKPLLNETGEVFQILAEGRDITLRKQTEAELQKLTAELEQRVKERTEQILKTNTRLEQEVCDRTVIEEQLKASEQFLNNILNTIPDPIYVKDEQHRWLTFNDAFCQYIEHSREELIGKSYDDFFPKKQADMFREKDELVFSTNTSSESQETLTDTAGTPRFFSAKKSTFLDPSGRKILVSSIREITNRVQMEEQMRQTLAKAENSQRLLRTVIDATPDCIFVKNQDRRYALVNSSFATAFGKTPAEIIGKNNIELGISADRIFGHFHTQTEAQNQIQESNADESAIHNPKDRVTLADGKVHIFDTQKLPLKDTEGKIFGFLGFARDITDRKQAEEMLRDRERLFRAIFDQSFQFMGLLKPDGTVLEINQTALSAAGVGIEDIVGTPFWETLWWQISSKAKQQVREAIALAAAGEVIRYEADVLVAGGAVVTVDFSLKPIKDDDGKVILLIPEGRDISDRKALEQELRLRQAGFDAFFAAASAGMFITDDKLRFMQFNEKLAELGGQPISAYIGKTVWEVEPLMAPTIGPLYERVLSNNEAVLNIELCHPTSAQPDVMRDWLASYFPLPGSDGKPIGIGAFVLEVTDRKNLERELALRQARFDAFFAAAPASMFIFDDQLRFVQANEKLAETTGPSVAEHLGKTVKEVVPEMVHTLQPMLEEILATNQPFLNIEVSGITLSQPGILRYWLASYFPLPGEDGKPIGVGGVAVEITDRKETITQLEETTAQLAHSESEFRQQTNLLQLLINSISEGVVAADEKGNFVLFNPAAENIFGKRATNTLPNEWTAKYGLFLPDTITPYPSSEIPLTRTIRGESVDDAEVFTRHAGAPEGLWVKINGRPLKDQTGAIKGGVVVCRNVTEEKASQQQMQQLAEMQERLLQELKTRQNALDEAAIVSETDLKGIITYVNARFSQVSGYTFEELLNRDHRIINSGYHPKSFFQEMWLTITRGLVWKGEIKNRRKDGSFYWVDSTIAPIFNTSGQIVKYIAIRFDITERKEAEEGLEKFAAERQAEADSMTQQVLKLLGEIKGAAQGDLTVRAEVTNDVLGAVADSFNFLIGSLRKVVTGIQTLAELVTFATDESITNTSQLTEQAEIQAVKISAIMREIDRIVNSIRDVRDVSVRAETVAQQSSHTAEAGGMAVDRAVEGINELRLTIASTSKMMKRLGESSQQIGKIVTSISQLASQTNLLALNATIEAARAGEQGLGFAVVAEEVRKLAERSAGATEEISEIVGTIQEEISRVMKAMESGTLEVVEGTKLASEAKTHLNAIIEVSREMNALVQNITRASAKQTISAEEISNSMQQVNEIANTTAQKGSDVKASLDDLSGSVGKLQKSVANFRS